MAVLEWPDDALHALRHTRSYDEAGAAAREALGLFQKHGDQRGVALTETIVGFLEKLQQHMQQQRRSAQQAAENPQQGQTSAQSAPQGQQGGGGGQQAQSLARPERERGPVLNLSTAGIHTDAVRAKVMETARGITGAEEGEVEAGIPPMGAGLASSSAILLPGDLSQEQTIVTTGPTRTLTSEARRLLREEAETSKKALAKFLYVQEVVEFSCSEGHRAAFQEARKKIDTDLAAVYTSELLRLPTASRELQKLVRRLLCQKYMASSDDISPDGFLAWVGLPGRDATSQLLMAFHKELAAASECEACLSRTRVRRRRRRSRRSRAANPQDAEPGGHWLEVRYTFLHERQAERPRTMSAPPSPERRGL